MKMLKYNKRRERGNRGVREETKEEQKKRVKVGKKEIQREGTGRRERETQNARRKETEHVTTENEANSIDTPASFPEEASGVKSVRNNHNARAIPPTS